MPVSEEPALPRPQPDLEPGGWLACGRLPLGPLLSAQGRQLTPCSLTGPQGERPRAGAAPPSSAAHVWWAHVLSARWSHPAPATRWHRGLPAALRRDLAPPADDRAAVAAVSITWGSRRGTGHWSCPPAVSKAHHFTTRA